MIFLHITCLTPQDQYTERDFGDVDLEACFETLTQLTLAGWKLIKIRYCCAGINCYRALPVDAFDGQSGRVQPTTHG